MEDQIEEQSEIKQFVYLFKGIIDDNRLHVIKPILLHIAVPCSPEVVF